MMNFRTEVHAQEIQPKIQHGSRILMMGSCFTQHIGKKLRRAGFPVLQNPFGISFNPLSIASGLRQIIAGEKVQESDLNQNGELFHSWSFHSSFSGMDSSQVLAEMNSSLVQARKGMKESSHLIISLGTAWVYRLKETGQVVNNCHKVPAASFDRFLLSVDEVYDALFDALKELKDFNPDIHVIFTLSPVRHWKDGAEENSISKSTLRLAIARIQKEGRAQYFPAYEIMMDDLRDYRFYTDDLLHPTDMAQEYIWRKFIEASSSLETIKIIEEVFCYRQMESHRSLHPGTSADLEFQNQVKAKRNSLLAAHPSLILD